MVAKLNEWCRYYSDCRVRGAQEKNCFYGDICQEFLDGSMPNRLLPQIVALGYLPEGRQLMLALAEINRKDAERGGFENTGRY